MDDFIILTITVLITAVASIFAVLINKKAFENAPVHIIGWRKKNRVILRDRRLVPALWKMRIWSICALFDIALMIIMIVSNVSRNNWGVVFGLITVGVITAIFLSVMYYYNRKKFYKLKNELGIVLEQDEKAIKEMTDANIKKQIPSYIVMSVMFMSLSISCLNKGDFFIAVLFLIGGISYLFILINYAVKKNRKD